MQASRTAHYAWLYRGGSRGSQRGQAQGWPSEVAPKQTVTSPEFRLGATSLRQRVSPLGRAPARASELSAEASLTAAAARALFIEAQIRAAVHSGIRQMVWLGPRVAQSAPSANSERSERPDRVEQGVEVEVFRIEADTLGAGRGALARLDRSLVRSARTLFVCDGLLERIPSAQIQAILRTIGESCFGSRLACVYLDGGSISTHLSSNGSQKPRCAVPRLVEPGEPTQLGIERRALPALLAGAGLVLDADVGLTEYMRRTLGEVPSDLRGYGCWQLAAAHVRARPPAQASDDNSPLN